MGTGVGGVEDASEGGTRNISTPVPPTAVFRLTKARQACGRLAWSGAGGLIRGMP